MKLEYCIREIDQSEIQIIETKHSYSVDLGSEFGNEYRHLPFGTEYLRWVEAKKILKSDNGAKLWEFDNGAFGQLAGRAGYCLTRRSPNGRDVMTGWVFVTSMS